MWRFDKQILGWEFTVWIIFDKQEVLDARVSSLNTQTQKERIEQFIFEKMWIKYPNYQLYFLWWAAKIDKTNYDFVVHMNDEKIK